MNGESQVDLKEVIAIVELDRRPSRPPNYVPILWWPSLEATVAGSRREASPFSKGWSRLRSSFAERIRLASAPSRTTTRARFFRWRAAAGQWAVHRHEVMSRDSPSGLVVDRNAALLRYCCVK